MYVLSVLYMSIFISDLDIKMYLSYFFCWLMSTVCICESENDRSKLTILCLSLLSSEVLLTDLVTKTNVHFKYQLNPVTCLYSTNLMYKDLRRTSSIILSPNG